MAYPIIERLLKNVETFGEKELYRFEDQNTKEWHSTSWNKFIGKCRLIATALIDNGVAPGDNVAMCSPNCPHILALDYGIFMTRSVSVAINPKESQMVFDHIMRQTEASVIFVGDRNQFIKAMNYVKANPDHKIKRIVLIWEDEESKKEYGDLGIFIEDFINGTDTDSNKKELEKRIAEASLDDLALISYVNVPKGMPKGAMIGHDQIQAAIDMHNKFLQDTLHPGQLSVSYLPMSHVFEKMWLYMCVNTGLNIAFCYNEQELNQIMKELKPHIIRAVPRFWEKFYTDFVHYYFKQSWWGKKKIKRAFKLGKRRNLYYRRTGRKTPYLIEKEYQYWNKKIFSKLRAQIGLTNPGIYPTTGAMLNDKIMGFVIKAGLDIYFGYGLVETTVPISFFPLKNPILGTVGKALEGYKIKIANNGEVMVKGPTLLRGYYKDEEATRAAFDSEGYLHTGDMGYITPGNQLVINGRKREIYKTSTGKIIPPVFIEKSLERSPLLQRVLTVADVRQYVTALVYPDLDMLRDIAKENGWAFSSDEELLKLPSTKELLMKEIEKYQENLAEYMRVRNIEVMDRDISRSKGEIGVNGDVRRAKVRENFLKQIDRLYPNEYIQAEPLFDLHQPF